MTNPKNQNVRVHWPIILSLASIKLIAHFVTNAVSGFGLHRDEYLYMAESDHLAWGYMEVPPMIAVIGKIARVLFGDNMFAVRFFPALIGAVTIVLLGIMIKDLGGRKWAQLVGCSAFLLSPAFLGSNNLFQPVSFNQFFWFLTAFILVRIVKALNTESGIPKNEKWFGKNSLWIFLGVTAGLGFLMKYSIVFFYTALILSLLISPYRKWFTKPQPFIALVLALIIVLPNLYWQYIHDLPVVRHMQELSTTQLVNMKTIDFVMPQFINHFGTTLIWLPGLVYVLISDRLRQYRFLGWAYIIVMIVIWMCNGKDYYPMGAYIMLFAFGGIAWEQWIGRYTIGLLTIIVLLNIPTIPLAIPVLPVDLMHDYSRYVQNEMGIEGPFRWEDGSIRDLRQDYADMLGWDELPAKVAKIYHNLSAEEKEKCLIYGGSYGHAGVLNFYKDKYDLPEAYSFNASFVSWLPEDKDILVQIQVDDSRQHESPSFYQVSLMDSIEHPYARDPGWIYLKSQPKMDLRPVWKDIVIQQKKDAGIYRIE